jgi:hypothetical protein
MMFAVLRVVIAVGGGWIAVAEFGGSQGLFAVLAFALVFYGLGNVASVAGGAWFKVPGKERAATEPGADALVRAR